MLLSMTGFGEARRHEGDLAVAVEIRTVNNRHLKLSIRISDPYGSLEPHIDAIVRKHIRRGSVQINIRVERLAADDSYRINRHVLEGYRKQLESLYSGWHLSDTVPLAALLPLPGVIDEDAVRRGDAAREWPLIEATLIEAFGTLSKMRAEEGQALAADLRDNCGLILAELEKIESRLPRVLEDYRSRLLTRVEAALEKFDVAINPGDVVREISLFVERSDVSEEIIRLKSHLEQFDATMAQEESSGRKLDFLSQEMFRETNTIGSKNSDVEIPKHVVEIKASIERMREQVQNIE